MTIRYENSMKKNNYIEILPTLAVSWYSGIVVYIGWLFFSVTIDL